MKIYFLLSKALRSLKRLTDPAGYSNPYTVDDLYKRTRRGFTAGRKKNVFNRRWAIR